MSMPRCDVLIVGAGPTGLVLALWLAKLGVAVRIVDKSHEAGTTSRAVAVQARTLELYGQLDLARAVVEHGHKVPAVNLWVKGKPAARIPFEAVGAGLTAYPFLQIFAQDEHERLLIDRLARLGVAVERDTEVLGFEDLADHIAARLRGPNGAEEACQAAYIAGCDGAHSLVRQTTGSGFPGGSYRQLFYVADVEALGPAFDGELHVDLDEADFLAVFPLADEGRARLIGTVRDERADRPESLKFEDVSDQAIQHLKIDVRRVNWFSTYRVHHRVTERFRTGRAFLLGDAAHVHSPVGGQGMNTGIGDAINLAWKLAAAIDGRAPDALLDSYEAERMAFARRLVATTDRVFSFVSADGAVADILRTRFAPFMIPKLAAIEGVRELLFRTVAQITLNYRDGPLSQGCAGAVHGGDRLPWAPAHGCDNFTTLSEMTWQAHVYGQASEPLSTWCAHNRLPLQVFDWAREHEDAGLLRDALYLIRPDSYVALADPSGSTVAVEQYFAARLIALGADSYERQRT